MWEKWWNLYLPIPSGREEKGMARLCAYGKRLKVSVSTFSASLIHQHDIAEWTWKERGGEGLGTKSPSLFREHLPMPCPTLLEICKEKNPLYWMPKCLVSTSPLCPWKKKLKALTGKSMVNFETKSWHRPASNKFINTSEKCWTSSAGSLGCTKSLKKNRAKCYKAYFHSVHKSQFLTSYLSKPIEIAWCSA